MGLSNIGVTNDLARRTYEHREGILPGFTKRHGIKQLVYFERHATAPLALQREKTLKHWPRLGNAQDQEVERDVARLIRGDLPIVPSGCSGQARA
jgi:predicted GIY-YIG superfamily endonuclease